MRERINRNEISTLVKIILSTIFAFIIILYVYLYQILIILDPLKIYFCFLLRERLSQNEISTLVKIIFMIFAFTIILYLYLHQISIIFDVKFLLFDEKENKSK